MIWFPAAAIFIAMIRNTCLAGLLALSLLASCNRPSNPREFADRFIAAETKAWATGSVDDLKALEDDAVVYHLPGLELTGWKAHEDYIVNGRRVTSDLKQNWKYLSGEGNHIVLGYDVSAVTKADDKNPSQTTSGNYLFVLRINEGRVAEVWANGSTVNDRRD